METAMADSTDVTQPSALAPLIGEWRFVTRVGGQKMGSGRTTFEWVEDRAFVLQRADDEPDDDASKEWLDHSPMPVTAFIGLDDSAGTYTMLYADARGVRRVYQMSLTVELWKVWRDAPGFNQRFTGTFDDTGRVITGRWEMSADGDTWDVDFEMTYTKV
jgi:hypothetical protein